MAVMFCHFLSLEIGNFCVNIRQVFHPKLVLFKFFPVEAVTNRFCMLLNVEILKPVLDVPLDNEILREFGLIATVLSREAVIVMQRLYLEITWDY